MIHNVVIIGGGIAAHTAALYLARANMNPLIISGPELDQLSLTSLVENYPGFPEGIMGPKLIQNCKEQSEKFGAQYIEGLVDSFKKTKGSFEVCVAKKKYNAKSLIICTGAWARKLGVPGEDNYFGRGVSTCAVCDAALYRDKIAVVVGGGDTAMEESLALSKFADKVIIIHRQDKFKASKIMQGRVFAKKGKIKVVWNSVVEEVIGDGKFVIGVKVKNNDSGKTYDLKTNGMFLAIGHIPNTDFLKGKIDLDEQGFIVTDKFSRTSVKGIYAAGDCQDPVFKQAITSAGTGCMAALKAEKHVESL
jgi:thioredoxin reductase (NADPH)